MTPESNKPVPPAWATRLLHWFCADHLADEIQGDLLEEFYYQAKRKSVRYARFDYVRTVFGFLRPFAIRRKHPASSPSGFMLPHYVRVGVRNILRNKALSSINVFGLTTGLCCCMLLLLYTKDETSFDAFHDKRENIYQLVVERKEQGGNTKHFAIAAMVQGPAFKQEIPEIENYVRVRTQFLTVKKEDHSFSQEVTWVDDSFFSVFSFPLMVGQPSGLFSNVRSAVISESTALNYFGKTEVVGKTIDLEIGGTFESFLVTGVAKNCPANSSIQFKIALPFRYLDEFQPDGGWHWVSFPTYFLLHPNADLAAVRAKMKTVYDLQARQEIDEMKLMGYGDTFHWDLHPLTQMHLDTKFEGTPNASNPLYAYILTAIAIFVLAVASINFINLTVAQSIRRALEIGVRKVLGGQRKQLAFQFLTETFLITSAAFIVAVAAVQLALPAFNSLSHKNLSLTYLFDWKLGVGAVLLLIGTSLLAGLYPALVLSRLSPADSLQNRSTFMGKNYLGRSLVVLQFALSSSLIIGTAFIYAQFSFLTQTNLGYDDQNLLEIPVDKTAMDRLLMRKIGQSFANVSGVESVAPRNLGKFGGPTKSNEREFFSVYTHADGHYVPTLGISILAGRNFSVDFPGDSIHSVMVNEAFVKQAGWSDAIGQTVDFMNIPGWGNKKLTIVGVVRNYHTESLRELIKPEILTYEPMLPYGKFMIKINEQNIPQTLASMESVFHACLPNDPFQFYFKDDLNNSIYQTELQLKKIIAIACVITVLIACMGLLALTAHSTERRAKEIGIRKILGASPAQILRVLSVDFLVLVAIGFAISIPVVYYVVDRWLAGFAYHVGISPWTFLLTAIIALMIALLTITLQSLKSLFSNPVKSLRSN